MSLSDLSIRYRNSAQAGKGFSETIRRHHQNVQIQNVGDISHIKPVRLDTVSRKAIG